MPLAQRERHDDVNSSENDENADREPAPAPAAAAASPGMWIVERADRIITADEFTAFGPEWFIRGDVPLGATRVVPRMLVGPPGIFVATPAVAFGGTPDRPRAERIARDFARRLRQVTGVDALVRPVLLFWTGNVPDEGFETDPTVSRISDPDAGLRTLQVQPRTLRPDERHIIRAALDDGALGSSSPVVRLAERLFGRHAG